MRITFMAVAATLLAATAYAHVVVAPQQSPLGASQVYKVRVHNDEKTAVTMLELDIPEGMTVTSVAPLTAGKVDSVKKDGRITAIVWTTTVAPAKYVELAFTATNPDKGSQVAWNVRERFSNGNLIEWSDKPAAKLKASATRLTSRPKP
jgi:uncharacterized protein YcnI